MRINEEKAKALLDEEEDEELDEEEEDEADEEEEEEQEAKEESEKEKKAFEKMTPAQRLKYLTSGKLKLIQPFRSHSEDVTEVAYDFCGLTSEEMMTALDTVPANNILSITNQQAMALFAATASKCSPRIEGKKARLYDARDIRERMGPADSIKAIQLAKLFYNASSQAGGNNISKE